MNATMIKPQTVVPDPPDPWNTDEQLYLFEHAEPAEPTIFVVPYRPAAQRTQIASVDYAILTWQTEWSADPPSTLAIERDRPTRLRELALWSTHGMGLDLEHLEDINRVGWGIVD